MSFEDEHVGKEESSGGKGGALSKLTTKQKVIGGGIAVAVIAGLYVASRKPAAAINTTSADTDIEPGNSGATLSDYSLPPWWTQWGNGSGTAPSLPGTPATPAPTDSVTTPTPVTAAPMPTPANPIFAAPTPSAIVDAPTPAGPTYAKAITPVPVPNSAPVYIPTASGPITPVTLPGLAISPTTTFGTDSTGQVHVITGSTTIGNGNAQTNGQIADALFVGLRAEADRIYGGATSRIEAAPISHQTTVTSTANTTSAGGGVATRPAMSQVGDTLKDSQGTQVVTKAGTMTALERIRAAYAK